MRPPGARLAPLATFALLLALAACGRADDAPAAASSAADTAPRHVVYLHGAIVQRLQSRRPEHPEFGPYELDAILDALRDRGFEVHCELRRRDATVAESAVRTAAQVRALREDGVAADHVTVVGASMGAAIALHAAALLDEPEIRYVLLGACASRGAPAIARGAGRWPLGRVLAIRESRDEVSSPCETWPGDADPPSGLDLRELVVDTGLRHGFLYRPLPVWLDAAAAWARTGALPR